MGIPYQCRLTLARGGLGRGVRVSTCGGGWLHVFALASLFLLFPAGGRLGVDGRCFFCLVLATGLLG